MTEIGLNEYWIEYDEQLRLYQLTENKNDNTKHSIVLAPEEYTDYLHAYSHHELWQRRLNRWVEYQNRFYPEKLISKYQEEE